MAHTRTGRRKTSIVNTEYTTCLKSLMTLKSGWPQILDQYLKESPLLQKPHAQSYMVETLMGGACRSPHMCPGTRASPDHFRGSRSCDG